MSSQPPRAASRTSAPSGGRPARRCPEMTTSFLYHSLAAAWRAEPQERASYSFLRLTVMSMRVPLAPVTGMLAQSALWTQTLAKR